MNSYSELTTPVALVIFNRPDCVKKSFEAIAKAKPKKLYIIADGPREDHPGDIALCNECRTIVEKIDWVCDVHKNYSDENLGCGKRPATGFSWVFANEKKAIIVEDDCIPSVEFFYFCQELLDKYEHDERIFSVSGMNFGFESEGESDYFYTHFNNTWGWATWKRVWDKYDFNIETYSEDYLQESLSKFMVEQAHINFWKEQLTESHDRRDKTAWDFQFSFLSFINNALHIYPKKNLVIYSGFDERATHTNNITSNHRLFRCTQEISNLKFPLTDPPKIEADFKVDYLIMKEIFNVSTDGLKYCNSISDDFFKIITQYSQIIIYGAGIVARELIITFAKNQIDKFNIAVTKLDVESYIVGNRVYELKDLQNDRIKSVVIIATVSKQYEKAMIDEICRLDFKHFIKISDYI
jgi:hypothetical protein